MCVYVYLQAKLLFHDKLLYYKHDVVELYTLQYFWKLQILSSLREHTANELIQNLEVFLEQQQQTGL